MDDFIKLFNFNLPPLLRVQLIKISVERHILMFDIHHSILDGTSLSIFTNEFAALYEERNYRLFMYNIKIILYGKNNLCKQRK